MLHFNAKKEEINMIVISAHPRNDPGPLVPKSDMLTTRPRFEVVRGCKITVLNGQTIRVSAIQGKKLRNFVHC